MYERFTERARQVVVLAQEEARTLKHSYVGSEHLLLGLLREEEGYGARVLESFDVTADRVRAQVVRIVGTGEESGSGQAPFTPRTKKLLELALREALSLGHNYIGTEHVLLALVREREGTAYRILLDEDVTAEKIRDETFRMLAGPGGRRSVKAETWPMPSRYTGYMVIDTPGPIDAHSVTTKDFESAVRLIASKYDRVPRMRIRVTREDDGETRTWTVTQEVKIEREGSNDGE